MDVKTLSLVDIEAYDPRPMKRGHRLRAKCPLHQGDHQQSLSVDTDTGWGKCFACGVTVRVFDFVPAGERPENRWRVEAVPIRRRATPSPVSASSPSSLTRCEKVILPLAGTPGAAYLESRGIPLAVAARYGVGYVKQGAWPGRTAARRWARITFPLATPEGVINYYSRAVGADVPKSERHAVLSGPKGYFHFDALGQYDTVYVCEAALDGLSLAVAGYGNFVAVIGTQHFRAEWFLAAGVKKIVLALDNDEAGRKAAAEVALKAALAGLACEVLPVECYVGEKDLNAALQKAGRLVLPGLGEPTPSDRAEGREEPSDASEGATLEPSAAYLPTEVPERDLGPVAGEYAAFWPRVDETRRAIAEFSERAAAFVRAWEKELGHNPRYPDAPAVSYVSRGDSQGNNCYIRQ